MASALFAARFVAGCYAADEPGSVMNHAASEDSTSLLASLPPLARSKEMARPALLLNAGIEVCDMLAAGLEVRERWRP